MSSRGCSRSGSGSSTGSSRRNFFDQILAQELAPDQAAAWSALAHRIGRSMRASVVDRETHAGGVPKLF